VSGPLGSWRWLVAASALLVTVVLSGVTVVALNLERDYLESRAHDERQTSLRLALWRLDSYLVPLVAREAARPWYDYRPFVPQERAFTRLMQELEPGEVMAPSPLLGFRSPLIPLHFELSAAGVWSSPQAPTGNLLDLAQENLADPEHSVEASQRLARLRAGVDPQELRRRVAAAESHLTQVALEDAEGLVAWQVANRIPAQDVRKNEQRRQTLDYGSRAKAQWNDEPGNQTWMSPTGLSVETGPVVPAWLEVGGAPTLAYLRRVETRGGDLVQGFLVDWEELRSRLLEEVADVAPGADLVPERGDPSDQSLATLPARLIGAEGQAGAPGWTPTRTALTALWLSALLVIGAFGFALRASVAYGERRQRFASAVTHELRTPLTTFRMYSEMLASGMVPPERVPEYVETLRRESDRLSGLVENVLAYARLEEGRAPLRREQLSVGELVGRLRPELERHVAECGGVLQVDVETQCAERLTLTDPDAVQQILFNLVDNACKYGAFPVRLCARTGGSWVELWVEDAGEGISPVRARSIFRPFDRGGRDESDGTPGVGLGLALARGLARDLQGELELSPAEQGTRFRLQLPGV
jgi:signal transduction histidine kinase